jgi:hypothetical protein
MHQRLAGTNHQVLQDSRSDASLPVVHGRACGLGDALVSRDRGPDASHRNGGGQVPVVCRKAICDALVLQDRSLDASRYRRNGGGWVPAACGSDALLLWDALLMHHVGMAAGSRQGDASSVGGRREPAGCGRSDAIFCGTEVLMHHVGMAVGRYQRHSVGVMHCFCGSPDASRRNGSRQQTR